MYLKRNPKTGFNTDLYGSLEDAYPLARLRTHGEGECAGRNCTIHDPSRHLMSGFPMLWREDRGMVERICHHGVGHPDPDQVLYWNLALSPDEAAAQAVHGCCGCCHGGA